MLHKFLLFISCYLSVMLAIFFAIWMFWICSYYCYLFSISFNIKKVQNKIECLFCAFLFSVIFSNFINDPTDITGKLPFALMNVWCPSFWFLIICSAFGSISSYPVPYQTIFPDFLSDPLQTRSNVLEMKYLCHSPFFQADVYQLMDHNLIIYKWYLYSTSSLLYWLISSIISYAMFSFPTL